MSSWRGENIILEVKDSEIKIGAETNHLTV